METPEATTAEAPAPASASGSAPARPAFFPRHFWWFWATMLFLLLMDQATKEWAENTLRLRGSIEVIPGFLSWTYVQNTGVAFGMAQGQNYVLAGLTVLLLGVGFWWARGLDWTRREVNLVAAFIVAGALGNLIDRLRLGYVVDFIDVLIPVINYRWPVFNLADSVICIAVGWIILRQFVGPGVSR